MAERGTVSGYRFLQTLRLAVLLPQVRASSFAEAWQESDRAGLSG
jgi:hypothetical protein